MVERENEIEKLFEKDSIEKKRIAKGAMHRASRKKGFRGGVLFPYELMSKKDQKEYTKSGKVEKYNMYDKLENVPQLDDISRMDSHKAKELISSLRSKHKNKDLAKHWGISTAQLYAKIYPQYGIITDELKKPKKYREGISAQEIKIESGERIVENLKKKPGYQISINGEYDGKSLASEITDIASMLERKEGTFNIELLITKKEEGTKG